MITFQGWATIRESYDEAGESRELLDSIHDQLKQIIDFPKEHEANVLRDLRYYNGELKLIIVGAANHKTFLWFKTLEVFQWISENAVGSYGLIYLHDDEDIHGMYNDFQVYCLKKGVLEHKIDSLLSPVVPEIEIL